MRIKQYIVTYKNNELLTRCLSSMAGIANYPITIIDNYGDCEVDTFGLDVKIIRNELRPKFSTGHLAKDWNAALVLGFESLITPDADIVILNQNDTVFQPVYLDNLIELHNYFDFIQMGRGDEMMSFTPRAVRRIGLFDERFSNIGYQEADYFFRARRYHPDGSTINDVTHNRVHNPVEEGCIIQDVVCGHEREEESTMASSKYHLHSQSMFYYKWQKLPVDRNWNEWPHNIDLSTINPTSSNIMYPYFEKDIETLDEQNYVRFCRVDENGIPDDNGKFVR